MHPCGIGLECNCQPTLCIPPEDETCVFNEEKSQQINPETGCALNPCSYDCEEVVPCPVVDCFAEPPKGCISVPDDAKDENGCAAFPCGMAANLHSTVEWCIYNLECWLDNLYCFSCNIPLLPNRRYY